MRLLLDGDILMFITSFSNEVATEVEPGYWTWYCDFNKVTQGIKESLDYYKNLLDADTVTICLSDDQENFRKQILGTYKEKRLRVKRPLVLKEVRRYLLEELDGYCLPNLEGDDVLGILATDPNDEEDKIIVSIDKDMQCIPGQLWYQNEVKHITPAEANRYHLYQTLTGDITDGYTGIPGIGAKKAEKILGDNPTWEAVVKAYEAAGLTEDDALIQARCAKILTYEDYDPVQQKPILWSPR